MSGDAERYTRAYLAEQESLALRRKLDTTEDTALRLADELHEARLQLDGEGEAEAYQRERADRLETGYLLALIDDLRARQRWIPVDLELPPSDVLVLVTAKGDVHACTYCPSYDEDEPGRWTAGEWPIYDVEAWQHMPAPYKKGAI